MWKFHLLQKQFQPSGKKKKDFHLTCTKIISASLKTFTPTAHPHHFSNGPSLTQINRGRPAPVPYKVCDWLGKQPLSLKTIGSAGYRDQWNKRFGCVQVNPIRCRVSAKRGSHAHVIRLLVLYPGFTPSSLTSPSFLSSPNTHKISAPPLASTSSHLHTPVSILNELALIHVLSI